MDLDLEVLCLIENEDSKDVPLGFGQAAVPINSVNEELQVFGDEHGIRLPVSLEYGFRWVSLH